MRSHCERLRSPDGREPKFRWRSADAQVRPALPQHCRVDNPGRHACASTKMPSVFGGLRCNRNWSRTFDIKRDVPTDGPIDPLPDFAVIPGSEKPAPHHLSDMGLGPISNTATQVNHFALYRILQKIFQNEWPQSVSENKGEMIWQRAKRETRSDRKRIS